MLKTFKQIVNFNTQADVFVKRSPTNVHTKLGYALSKVTDGSVGAVLKNFNKAYRDAYFDKVRKAMIDNALTDKVTGAVLLSLRGSERPYLFAPEGLKNVIKAEADFNDYMDTLNQEWENKEFEINPYMAAELPEDLTDLEREAFKGFVLE